MFRTHINLRANLNQFVFSNDRQKIRLSTFLYVTEEMKIAAVGEIPVDTDDLAKVELFGAESDYISMFLEPFIRYGIYRMASPYQWFAPVLKVTLDSDIQAALKGTAPDIFRRACLGAGAGKVDIELEHQLGESLHSESQRASP